jgi:hypothetical protein
VKLGGRKKESAPKTPLVLPERSESVTLATSDGTHIPARVVESAPGEVTIAITMPTKPLTPQQLAGLVLEYNNERGRARLQGNFTMPDPSDPDLLRIEAPSTAEVLQQRNFVRVGVARPVTVYGGGGEKIETFTVDISGGGFLLAGPDTLSLKQEINFKLSIVNGEVPVTGTGTVVRLDNQGRRGVMIDKISDFDRRRLVRFLFECQRNQIRRGVGSEDSHG